ncbi:MAG: tetratricopeptide repeat protein [bacterium]|nr:tetratricopeptide repeat protein [bacterium]
MSTNTKNSKKEKEKDSNADQAKLYAAQADDYMEKGKVAEAIAEYNKAIELDSENPEYFYHRGLGLLKREEIENSFEDFSVVQKIDPEGEFAKEIDNIYQRIHLLSAEELTKKIKQDPSNAQLYRERGGNYQYLKMYKEAIADYQKAIELNIDDLGVYFDMGECYFEMGDYEQAWENYNHYLDRCDYCDIDDKLAEKLEKISLHYEREGKYEIAMEILENILEKNWGYFLMVGLQDRMRDIERVTATIEERNKIIADLSHSIKNLISTVIDPLDNLRDEQEFKPHVIENALKGANLIREIVNGINLSFKGSIDDFYYDAKNNAGKDSVDFSTIIFESLTYSINNMFDGKYFSTFVRQYFPTKSSFQMAKNDWAKISSDKTISEAYQSFLKKYDKALNASVQ